MLLRTKILAIIGATLIGLLALVYFASRATLLANYLQLENELAQQNLQRALNALDTQLAGFARSNEDWAHWDDTNQFILDNNDDYRTGNLIPGTYETLDINAVAYRQNSGTILFATGYDTEADTELPLPDGFTDYLAADSPLVNIPELTAGVSGLVLLPQGAMLVASHNILTGSREGPATGHLIWGRWLDQLAIDEWAASTQLSLHIEAWNDPNLPPDFQAVQTALELHPTQIRPLNEDELVVYALLPDLNGKPILILRLVLPRSVYQQGQVSIAYFAMTLLAAGVVFVVVVGLLLEFSVLARLGRLSNEVARIGEKGSESLRVTVAGADELTGLARKINHSLDALYQSQTALHENAERLQLVVQAAPIILFALDYEGKFTLFEGQKANIFNLSLVGRSIYSPSLMTQIPQVIRIFEGARQGDTVHATLPIRDFTLEVVGLPLKNAQQEIIGVIGVATDISDQIKAQEEMLAAKEAAESANAAKSAFLATMSHELRTPLNAIIGYSELVIDELEDQEHTQYVPDLQRIRNAGQHLLLMISDILDLSRIEAGEMGIKLEQVQVSNLLKEVVDLTLPIVEKNKNVLQVHYEQEPATLYTDERKVRQILLNILNNACKFTENGTVTLHVKREVQRSKAWVVFTIEDTGIGIASEQMNQLFKEFNQGDMSARRKYGGTGLGLAISQRFSHMLGGNIVAKSEVGKGSVFTIILPEVSEVPLPETASS